MQRYPLILASKSPRRQELLAAMNLEFHVVLKDVDESFSKKLEPAQIAVFIAEKKALAFVKERVHSLVITADTIVAFNGEILGKPSGPGEAREMLTKLSGSKHDVYTGVTLAHGAKMISFYDVTEVYFKPITAEQIDYYIKHYNPYDKAGSYGIQDWIGLIAVEKIVGSYTNVMGMPTEKLYTAISNF